MKLNTKFKITENLDKETKDIIARKNYKVRQQNMQKTNYFKSNKQTDLINTILKYENPYLDQLVYARYFEYKEGCTDYEVIIHNKERFYQNRILQIPQQNQEIFQSNLEEYYYPKNDQYQLPVNLPPIQDIKDNKEEDNFLKNLLTQKQQICNFEIQTPKKQQKSAFQTQALINTPNPNRGFKRRSSIKRSIVTISPAKSRKQSRCFTPTNPNEKAIQTGHIEI